MATITLLSDFGLRDPYVGIMKGVILSINPNAAMVDITHAIPAQDILQAAFTIYTAYAYFPPGTIHVCVVDPGVGSHRAILALAADQHVFLAPDNGLLSYIVHNRPVDRVFRVEDDRFFSATVSQTFHGRDIFAPVAAHLSLDVPLTALGPETGGTDLQRLHLPAVDTQTPHSLTGTILWIDHFGNLISSIDRQTMSAWRQDAPAGDLVVELNGIRVCGLVTSYAAAEYQEPLLIIGSHGHLEIAVNSGSAENSFRAKRGDHFTLSTSGRQQKGLNPKSGRKL